jgi:hypothetical protein
MNFWRSELYLQKAKLQMYLLRLLWCVPAEVRGAGDPWLCKA